MAFNNDLLAAIDDRVAKGNRQFTAIGTVASRTFDQRAMITFDGSGVAVPATVFGDVNCYAGDRVALMKFGSDWCVVGTFTKRFPDHQGITYLSSSSGSTNSATYANWPGPPIFYLTKRWDSTRIWVYCFSSCYADETATGVEFGVSLNSTGGVGTIPDEPIGRLYFNVANQHMPLAGATHLVQYPAGTYAMTARWRRFASFSGTGSLVTDSNDYVSFGAAEVSP